MSRNLQRLAAVAALLAALLATPAVAAPRPTASGLVPSPAFIWQPIWNWVLALRKTTTQWALWAGEGTSIGSGARADQGSPAPRGSWVTADAGADTDPFGSPAPRGSGVTSDAGTDLDPYGSPAH